MSDPAFQTNQPSSPVSTIQSIEALRALACLLVVYCHLVGRPIAVYKESWIPYSFIRDYLTVPLGILHNFGALGVALFFLISGFIITHTGQNETRWSFLVKRIFRIHPPLIVVVCATVLLAYLGAMVGLRDGAIGTGHTNALLSAFGIDTGLTKKAVLAVGWTITIELIFYAHVFLIIPLLRSNQTLAVAVIVFWSVLLVYIARALKAVDPQFGTLATLSQYLPVFAMGMALYFYWSSKIPLGRTVILIALAWIAFITNMKFAQPHLITAPAYPSQVAYALPVFLGALWFYGRSEIRNHAVVRFFADISYSLYLIHLPFGTAMTMLLYPRLGLSVAIVASFAFVVGLSYLTFRFIERPAQRMGRKLLAIPLGRPAVV